MSLQQASSTAHNSQRSCPCPNCSGNLTGKRGMRAIKAEKQSHGDIAKLRRGAEGTTSLLVRETPSILLPPAEGFKTYSQECGRRYHSVPSPSKP